MTMRRLHEPSKMEQISPTVSPKMQVQLLHALPQIVILIGENNEIRYVNAKAELYFNASSAILLRMVLGELFPFDSPIISLVRQVQRGQSGINEYNVEIASIRHKANELMDLQVTPMAFGERSVIVVMQPRSIAQKIERQLAHQGAARSLRAWLQCWPTKSEIRCLA